MVGLLVSFFLLCAAAIMTRKPPSFQNHPSLDGPGVLQLAWLFGRDPSVAQHIAGATYDPSVHALRGAGMMKANLTSATHYGPPGAVGEFGMGDMSNSMQFPEPRPMTDEGVPVESARLSSDPHHSDV